MEGGRRGPLALGESGGGDLFLSVQAQPLSLASGEGCGRSVDCGAGSAGSLSHLEEEQREPFQLQLRVTPSHDKQTQEVTGIVFV